MTNARLTEVTTAFRNLGVSAQEASEGLYHIGYVLARDPLFAAFRAAMERRIRLIEQDRDAPGWVRRVHLQQLATFGSGNGRTYE